MLSSASAKANGIYKLVGCECDAKGNAVVITYVGAYGDAGKKMMKNKGPQQWDLWKLIELTKDGNFIHSTKTVGGRCRLEDGTYDIRLGPLPGNGNLQGMCGGHMAAWAEVRRGPDVVLPHYALESGNCMQGPGALITVKIIIEASKKPVF